MGNFNLDDYAPVEERIALFYEGHPEGRIHTTVERLEPPLVVFRAEVYRDAEDTRPWATGYAYEKEGEGHVNRTSYIENCETSAIGRALANAGYHGKRDGSPRPSREEMEKVERMGSTPANGAPGRQPQAAPEGDMIDCPSCSGPMWDNRLTKKGRQPDLKCRDRECDKAIWLDGWAKDLERDLNAVGAIADLTEFDIKQLQEQIKSGSPAQMQAAHRKLHEEMTPA
jgi:hypothetical protein